MFKFMFTPVAAWWNKPVETKPTPKPLGPHVTLRVIRAKKKAQAHPNVK